MNNAKRLRYEAGVSRAVVAIGSGVSVPTVGALEDAKPDNHEPIRADKAKRIADYYGVTVGQLLSLEPLPHPIPEPGTRETIDDDTPEAA